MCPANDCLKVKGLLQIIFCSCLIEPTLLCENGGSVPRAGREFLHLTYLVDQKDSDRMIKQLFISFIAKYSDLPVSRRSPLTNRDMFANLAQ